MYKRSGAAASRFASFLRKAIEIGHTAMIYFDNSATTRVFDEAASVAVSYMKEGFFNPSAAYSPAVSVEREVNLARGRLAAHFKSDPSELIFTSGGTESNNIALSGTLAQRRDKCRIITTASEHPSVYEPVNALKSSGYDVVIIGVDERGKADAKELEAALTDNTGFVSIMHVNNEVGAVNDIGALYSLVKSRAPGAVFHSDGVQAFLKMPAVRCDMYSFSGHKLHAPKGVGGLFVKRGVKFAGDDQRAAAAVLQQRVVLVRMADPADIPAVLCDKRVDAFVRQIQEAAEPAGKHGQDRLNEEKDPDPHNTSSVIAHRPVFCAKMPTSPAATRRTER